MAWKKDGWGYPRELPGGTEAYYRSMRERREKDLFESMLWIAKHGYKVGIIFWLIGIWACIDLQLGVCFFPWLVFAPMFLNWYVEANRKETGWYPIKPR